MNEIVEKIKERLNKNNINTKEEFKHELREITQELVMAGLANTDFFKNAVFHGGTSLRLLYRVKRYSEDLDFVLEKKDEKFSWNPYLINIQKFANQFGCQLEITDKSHDNNTVKKAFVKDNSIEQMLNMSWTIRTGTPEKIKIKLEIDSNPPSYFNSEIKTYNYPVSYDLKVQELSSLFAGKCHALLCRDYEKGRDWFDLNWFIKNGVEPNYKYFDSMLNQLGPWKNLNINSDKLWLSNELNKKITGLNYNIINRDINKFSIDKSNVELDKNILFNVVKKFNEVDYGSNSQNLGKEYD
jgi:predicted nucleotidyltransferase component of viral defense system